VIRSGFEPVAFWICVVCDHQTTYGQPPPRPCPGCGSDAFVPLDRYTRHEGRLSPRALETLYRVVRGLGPPLALPAAELDRRLEELERAFRRAHEPARPCAWCGTDVPLEAREDTVFCPHKSACRTAFSRALKRYEKTGLMTEQLAGALRRRRKVEQEAARRRVTSEPFPWQM
jgi:hypothetical protein